MALYWVPTVGGVASGNWSDVSTANWSATSGGAPGAGPATATDDIFFDANSGFVGGSKTVTMTTSAATGRNVDWTGAPNSPIWAASSSFSVTLHGNLTLISAMSFNIPNGNASLTLDAPTAATTYNLTFATKGVSVGTGNLILSGSGNFKLIDGLTVNGSSNGGGTFRPSCVVDFNGQAVSCGAFQPQGTTGIDFNGSTVTVVGGGTNSFLGGNITLSSTASLGALNMTFASGCEWNNSTGTTTFSNIGVTITGSCTTWAGNTSFYDLTLSTGRTYSIPYGKTQTATNTFTCNGTVSSLITVNASGSSSNGAANLCVPAPPSSSVSYTTFTNITANCNSIIDDGGNDGGGNNGIDFGYGGAPFGLLLELSPKNNACPLYRNML